MNEGAFKELIMMGINDSNEFVNDKVFFTNLFWIHFTMFNIKSNKMKKQTDNDKKEHEDKEE